MKIKQIRLTQHTLLYCRRHKKQSQASAFRPDSPKTLDINCWSLKGKESQGKRERWHYLS